MKNQLVPIFLVSIASFCGAAANILFKNAATQINEVPLYRNWPLSLGLILFTLVLVLFLTAFRLGGKTIVIYPTYATTYIWIIFLSYKLDGTSVSKMQLIGMSLIILGVSLIGFGTKD